MSESSQALLFLGWIGALILMLSTGLPPTDRRTERLIWLVGALFLLPGIVKLWIVAIGGWST